MNVKPIVAYLVLMGQCYKVPLVTMLDFVNEYPSNPNEFTREEKKLFVAYIKNKCKEYKKNLKKGS